jgi:hypothetical protein
MYIINSIYLQVTNSPFAIKAALAHFNTTGNPSCLTLTHCKIELIKEPSTQDTDQFNVIQNGIIPKHNKNSQYT